MCSSWGYDTNHLELFEMKSCLNFSLRARAINRPSKADKNIEPEEMPKDEEAADYPRILGQKPQVSHASESKAWAMSVPDAGSFWCAWKSSFRF